MPSQKLAALCASFAIPDRPPFSRVPLGHEGADLCLKGGLRRGALHEVFAPPGHEAAATGFGAGLAIRAAGDKRALWIALDFPAREFGAPAAAGLAEFGLDPARLLLVRARGVKEALQAALEAFSCTGLGAVVIEIPGAPEILDLTASRRLNLAAAQRNVAGLMLRFTAKTSASAAETRWLVQGRLSQQGESWGYPVFDADLIRHRHGGTGRWIMEWSCDHGLFQTPAAHSGPLVPAFADRPAAARKTAEDSGILAA